MDDFVLFNGVDNGLDFIRIDDSGNIGVGKDWSFKLVVRFFRASFTVGSKNGVESFEGGLSPDAETTQLTSRG